MHWIDWTILGVYLIWIVWDGLRLTKKSGELEGYFLASRSIPWWAVGLSVMATQLSAITMIGTTGQGYADGMRFIQFYYALPIAMIILSVTLVPFFHNARVFTAYEYLERRFDAKTRSFTALLFLISRAMACGAVISAPAVVLSVIMGVERHHHLPADGRADGHLHDVRRCPGGDVDGCEADVSHRLRPAGRLRRAAWSACPTRSASPMR